MSILTNPDANQGDIIDAVNAAMDEATAAEDADPLLLLAHAQCRLLAMLVDRVDEILDAVNEPLPNETPT